MTYFIFNANTYRQYRKPNGFEGRYATERAAKAQLTKLTKAGKLEGEGWKYDTATNFYNSEPLVEVKNLMSGLPVMIPLSSRGGPTDVSTERYWSE